MELLQLFISKYVEMLWGIQNNHLYFLFWAIVFFHPNTILICSDADTKWIPNKCAQTISTYKWIIESKWFSTRTEHIKCFEQNASGQ